MTINRSDDEQKRANEIFDSLRDELRKRELSNTENYDKAILTLSAAALGLSLSAIRFIVPLETAEYIFLIKLGWDLLLVSITTSLVAYLMSNKAITEQLKNAEDYYTRGIEEAFNKPNKYINFNAILNYATGVAFIIAISSIVIFVIVNVDQGEMDMSKKSGGGNSTKVFVKDSASIPTMQQVQTGTDVIKKSASIPTMQQAPGTSSGTQSGSGSSSSSSGTSNSGSSGSNNDSSQ